MSAMVQSALLMSICNGLLVVGWTALLVAPAAHRLCWFAARTCAMLLAAVWAVLAVIAFGPGIPGQLWGSGWPESMMRSLSVGELALMQFKVFNLFVASWQVEDGPRHKIPHIWLLPGLVATALSGPFGLMIHMAIRDVFKLRQKRQAAHIGEDRHSH